jgi:hypothetical protein
MQIIATLAYVGSLVCWIMTLIKMFQNDKILLGILGIICPLWSFIWGWMNKDKAAHPKLMLIWTICAIIGAVTANSFQ